MKNLTVILEFGDAQTAGGIHKMTTGYTLFLNVLRISMM